MAEDKSTYKIEARYNPYEGVLEINIPNVIAQLSNGEKTELAKLHLFDSAMWEELKHCIRTEYTSENYNSTIHKLRIELLGGDGADEILKRTVRGILMDLKRAQEDARRFRQDYWDLRNWCWDHLGHEQQRAMPKEAKFEYVTVTNEDVETAIAEKRTE